MKINLKNIELFNIMRSAFTNFFPNRKLNILDFMKIKLIRLNFILMIFSFGVSATLHTHEATGISFYETGLEHIIRIENVKIDDIDANLAIYDFLSAPTGDLDELLSQRDTINTQLLTVFDSAPDPWSLKSPGLKLKIFSTS